MAERMILQVTDDLTGGDADYRRTVALDDKIVRLDLNKAHAEELDELLARWMDAGVTVTELHPRLALNPTDEVSTREYNTGMRAWAIEHGYGDEIKVLEKGGYYHSSRLKDAYADYLAQLREGRQRG